MFEKEGSELFRLNHADFKKSFEGIQTDLNKFALACVFNELLMKAVPKFQPVPEVFKLYINSLSCLEQDSSLVALLNLFLLKLMHWGGQLPRLQACQSCKLEKEKLLEEEVVFFNIEEAGWVCHRCRTPKQSHSVSIKIIHETENALRYPIKQALQQIRSTESEQREWFKIIEKLFYYHIPGLEMTTLKSLKLLQLH